MKNYRDFKMPRHWRQREPNAWKVNLRSFNLYRELIYFEKCKRTLFEPKSKEPYSSSKIEIKFSRRLFTSSIKRDIRHFTFVVVQWWQIKKLQKIVMHSQSCCLAYSTYCLFWCSPCRRPRGILKSLFTNCGVVQINV